MIRPSLRRIAVLVLCLVLAGSGLLSAKPRVAGAPDLAAVSRGDSAGFWDTGWSFLVSVWARNGASGDPFGVGPKNGSAGDPNGKPSSGQPSQPKTKNGCHIDPNGQCLPGN
jgi:hypothetical protein